MTEFLLAEAAIGQLHERYGDAIWRKDYEAFGDCFTEHAQWRFAGRVVNGRAEIVRTNARLMSAFRQVMVTTRKPILDVKGDGTATSRTYVSEQSFLMDGQSFVLMAVYYTRYVDEGDRWRFSWRLCDTYYAGPGDMSGPLFANPDYGPPPAMPDLDAPTIDHTGLGEL